MGKLLLIILVIVICTLVCALPLYLTVNFACWVFHLSFRLTILQSIAVCLLINVLRSLLFGHKDGE